jgi:hypothetical protein
VPANLQSNVALKSTVSDLWQNVLSARTYQTYNVGYRTYTSLLASNGVIWIGKRMSPISEDILIYFVAHCFKNLKLFTILQNFDPTTNLCVADVEIFYSYANLHLKASKSDPFRKGVTIQLDISNHTICPFSVIKKYMAVRRGREAPFCLSDPLFIKEDGCALDK